MKKSLTIIEIDPYLFVAYIIKFNGFNKCIFIRNIKHDKEQQKKPKVYTDSVPLRPWNFDIVPWRLSHARHNACTLNSVSNVVSELDNFDSEKSAANIFRL